MKLQVQLHGTFDYNHQKWNNELKNKKDRKIRSDYCNELEYLWSSDPDRKSKGLYDSGEVLDINAEYEIDAIRRDLKNNALVGVRTGKSVFWSDFEGKWIDSE